MSATCRGVEGVEGEGEEGEKEEQEKGRHLQRQRPVLLVHAGVDAVQLAVLLLQPAVEILDGSLHLHLAVALHDCSSPVWLSGVCSSPASPSPPLAPPSAHPAGPAVTAWWDVPTVQCMLTNNSVGLDRTI